VPSTQALYRELAKLSLRTVLALLFIPLLVWGFSVHVQAQRDSGFLAALDRKVASEPHKAQQYAVAIALFRANPPSRACVAASPELRAEFCAEYSEAWQFHWARKVAGYALMAAVLLLLTVAALGLAAFRGRAAQYRSLVLAWRVLALSSALEVILQSVMLVWLSFWLTAFFFEVYILKLVVLVGILAGMAVFAAVVKIFARSQGDMALEGELVAEADAPALWERIRALAAQLGTAAPDNIVAGIDSNFFVTESKLALRGQVLDGRTLFVSLPLLRVLDQGEADAVLAHELAHLSGGDTASGAALGPMLVKFDSYRHEMSGAGLTLIAWYLLSLYRVVFELAWKRDSREREFLADRTAAKATSGGAVTRSLIKVIAYSSYRNKVEADLFSRQDSHGESIGIAAFVAQGLHPFAGSGDFLSEMETASVPHPFDSHPSLDERMRNVDSVLPAQQFGAVMTAEVASSWTSRITTAEAIEARLWADYEARFAQAHEHDLAYRYLPRDDAERAIVEKYFPVQVFALKRESLTVAYDGLLLPGEMKVLGWQDVSNIEYEDGYLGDVLKLTLTEKGTFGNKTNKVKLPGIKPQRDQLKSALGQYWHRNKVARGVA
jgi:Zn-dependent protease with chaperone function